MKTNRIVSMVLALSLLLSLAALPAAAESTLSADSTFTLRNGIRFGYPSAVCANPFLSCLAINMLGRCLCGRGFFCC